MLSWISDVFLDRQCKHSVYCFLLQLAPSLPLQEDFVYHWKAITHYYIETSGKKSLKGQTNFIVMIIPRG